MTLEASRIQQCTCPTCGGYLGEAAPLSAVREQVGIGHQLTIFDSLSRRVGNMVTSEGLIDAMYSDRSDGGPDNATSVLTTTVSRLKDRVEGYGWTIVSFGRGKGNSASYKLVPLQAGA